MIVDTICACGRKMSKYYFNSTIRRKMCPSCELKSKIIVSKNKIDGQTVSNKPKSKSEKSRARNRADEWFSRYIRIKHSTIVTNGISICKCYTCGKLSHPKLMDNGHWQRRGYTTVRFDENNARPQCYQCNRIYQGKPEVFERNLVRDFGQEEVNRIKELAFERGEDNEFFYRRMANKYRNKTNELLKQTGIIKWW